jgi:hypothetical protein
MIPRSLARLATAAIASLALLQLSCASAGLTPAAHAPPAERIALAPEYRVFYDALQDYGDWVFVPGLNYCFRPKVNFIAWRPYEDGFWAPSDLYGWTWISGEPFGWATYHYGRWNYDRYYGWVWAPGLDWGPAWVAWGASDAYAGWSPLLAPPADDSGIPGGAWSFAPLDAFGTTGLGTRIVHAPDLGVTIGAIRPVQNVVEVRGVTINRGPSYDLVERHVGRLEPVHIEARELHGPVRAPGGGRAEPTTEAAQAAKQAADDAHRAVEESARQAKEMAQRGGSPPPSLTLIRTAPPTPEARKHAAAEAKKQAREGNRGRAKHVKAAAADSTKKP